MTIRFRASIDEAAALLRAGPRLTDTTFSSDVLPGREAPAVRADESGTIVVETMRWGFPPSKGTRPVCHVANIASIYWRPWLRPAWRCAIPVGAFSEYSSVDHTAHWFGSADEDVLWLAALWRPLSGKRTKPLPSPEEDPRVFALVNAPANRMIAEHHPDSMPTIVKRKELDVWLHAPKEIAFELRRPLNTDLLKPLN